MSTALTVSLAMGFGMLVAASLEAAVGVWAANLVRLVLAGITLGLLIADWRRR